MNSPVSTRRRAPDRDTILDGAARLFEERGFQNTTMQDLADHLGIAKPTLYVHAKSKLEILEGIFERVMRESDARMEEAKTLPRPTEQLDALIRYWTRTAIALSAHYKVFFADERELPPRLVRYYRRWSSEGFSSLRDIVVQGQRAGDYDPELDPTAVAFAIIGVTNWTARWFHTDGARTPDEIADTYCRLIGNGLAVAAPIQTTNGAAPEPARKARKPRQKSSPAADE